jgi:phosphomannomutase
VLDAYRESGSQTLAEFAAGVEKLPQIIASAYVGNGRRLEKQEVQTMETDLLKSRPELLRANLRYSGTEPLFRIMLESEKSCTERDLAMIAVQIAQKVQEAANQPDGSLDILNCTKGGLLKVKP